MPCEELLQDGAGRGMVLWREEGRRGELSPVLLSSLWNQPLSCFVIHWCRSCFDGSVGHIHLFIHLAVAGE